MGSVDVGSEEIKVDDEITIVKIVRPPSDDDIEIVFESVSKGSTAAETADFLHKVCQCHSHKVTVTPSEEEVVDVNVDDDSNVNVEESESPDVDDGTAARTRPVVFKGRRPLTLTLPPGYSSPAIVVGVMPPPHPHQNQHRPSANRKEGESPRGISPHDPDDKQHGKAKEISGDHLNPGQEMEIVASETTQIKRTPVSPGRKEDLVGPLVPAKKGTKRNRVPPKTRTTGKGRAGKKNASKDFSSYFFRKTTQTKRTRTDLRTHTHTKEAPFKCTLCDKEFIQQRTLKDHTRHHLKEKPYKCPHPGCFSSFVRGSHLKDHSRIHSGEKPFKCPLCGKGFVQKGGLNIHIRRHVKEKNFKCPHPGCSSSFVTGSGLKGHSRVHSGEKPFACPHPSCDKAFSQSSHLKGHARIHTGEKPYACLHPGCGKAFSQSSHLRTHSRVHSGEKPYSCPFPGCGKFFSDPSSFSRHRKIHARSAANNVGVGT